MTGSEFLRRIRRLARNRGWEVTWHPDRGKGSHGRLILNGRVTTVRYLKDEISKGTLHAMIGQLGIDLSDLMGN